MSAVLMPSVVVPALSLLTPQDRMALLIDRIKQRDHGALRELYLAYSARIKSYALRVLHDEHAAEDITHDVFLRVWRYASAYDHAKVGRPEAWLFQIARNQAMNHAVQRARVSQLGGEGAEQDEQPELADPHDDGRDRLIDRVSARSDAFSSAVVALPSHYRQVLFLRFHHDMSNPEIAAHLGLPLGTVKTWLRRGLIHLRQSLRVDGVAPAGGLE